MIFLINKFFLRGGWLLMLLLLFSIDGKGQQYKSLSTSPPLSGGNGANGITFNIEATNATVIVDSLYSGFYGTANNTADVWYNPAAINGKPTINTVNGWIKIGSVNLIPLQNSNSTFTIQKIPLKINVKIPKGSTYGFFIQYTNVVYTSYTTGTSNFSDGTITIQTGTNIGYGGSTQVNHPRQFNGKVVYHRLITGPNDVGVTSIDSPSIFCPGKYDVYSTIGNFGTNRIDTVNINWAINGVTQTPVQYKGGLDTSGGTGPSSVIVKLGSANFSATNAYTIKVWTSKPNNKIDTVNSNDTMSVVIRPSLVGTYTIGGTSPDFKDFNSAVNALNSFGICGAVTFNVRNGIYKESIKLNEIRGASATNTITFQSASGDSSQVVLRDSATATAENYVVQLNGTDYIRFKRMTIQAVGGTYARVLDVLSGATNNEFHNNVFLGITTTTSSTNNAVVYSTGTNDDYNLFMNNRIVGGSYGMYWYGTSSSNWEKGTRIIGNTLQNQYVYGIRLFYHENAELRSNKITTNTAIATYYGLYMSTIYDTVTITENQVIRTTGGGYGFYFTKLEGSLRPVQVANNFISMAGTGTSYGIYNDASILINYHHNTVVIYGTSTAGRVFNITGASGFLSIYNNNFVNLGGGYTYYAATAQTGAIDSSDYNNLYTTGTNIAFWGSNITGGLTGWQNSTLMDTNSISVNPQFASSSDYTPANFALKNAAIKLADVDFDIEGRLRDTTAPDIGAVEIFLGNDVSIESLITPSDNSCGSRTEQIGIVIKNRGKNTQTAIPVALVINNNPASIIRDTLAGTFELNEIDTLFIKGGINTVPGGTYNLKIYTNLAGDERNTNDTATATFIKKPAPIPGFTFNTPCFGESVKFIDTSIVDLLGALFFWDFGDGSPRTIDYNPEHFYSTPGTYNVTMVLRAVNGCEDSVTTAVTVHPLPVAAFGAETVCRGTSMNFTDSSSIASGNIIAYKWSFGDGDSSSLQNPTHAYAAARTYNVRLIVASNNGCMDTITNQVTVLPAPIADFSANNSCSADAVQFKDSSIFSGGTIVSRTWKFGDGSISSDNNPSHIYTASGIYNVTLIVKSDKGCEDSITKQVTVYPNPVAAFNVSSACVGKDVTFTNKSTVGGGGTLNYMWTFGDGGTSNLANPLHNYSQPGTYKVSLVTISGNNCIDSVSQTINVNALPNPKWTMQVVEGKTVTFIPQDTTLANYTWQYGDGNFSTRMKPTRTYAADGTYIVTLTVRSAGGCENSFTDTITITSVGVNEIAAPQIGLNVYPNPFSESTIITYELEKQSNINISVYDMAGKEITQIADKVNVSGRQVHTFDAAQHNLKAGIYLLRIILDDNIISKQIIKLK